MLWMVVLLTVASAGSSPLPPPARYAPFSRDVLNELALELYWLRISRSSPPKLIVCAPLVHTRSSCTSLVGIRFAEPVVVGYRVLIELEGLTYDAASTPVDCTPERVN